MINRANPLQPPLLDDMPSPRPDAGDGENLREQFEEFHENNPHVYTRLRAMALQLRARGVKRYGIGALYERLRYDHVIQTGDKPYKLGNSYRAFYARLLMAENPELAGFFEVRKQPSQEAAELAELEDHWPSLEDCPDGQDIFRDKYGAPTGEPPCEK